MHELAVCQGLMAQINRISAEHGDARIERVTIRIGALSGVEPDLLAASFPIASAGSVAENAELLVTEIPPVVFCPQCRTEKTVRPNRLICPECNAWQVRVVAGDELVLETVELLAA